MARTWILAMVLAVATVTIGCDRKERIIDVGGGAPHTVEDVYSVTGDEQVAVYWRENQESDIDHYRIYRNSSATGTFTLIGEANHPPFIDTNVNNGQTYFYAVSAVDNDGRESIDLSFENVFDTPRPEGTGVTLTNSTTAPTTSGWDFSSMARRSDSDPLTDIYYSASGASFLITAATDVDIQDAGYVDLIDVDFGPPANAGWSADGIVEAIPGHSYIVLTADNHYAKFHVVSRDAGDVVIDWAYQIDQDNPELAPKISRSK